MKQGGRYGVRLKASAPSIHIQDNKQKFQDHQPPEWQDVFGGCDARGITGCRWPHRNRFGREGMTAIYYLAGEHRQTSVLEHCIA